MEPATLEKTAPSDDVSSSNMTTPARVPSDDEMRNKTEVDGRNAAEGEEGDEEDHTQYPTFWKLMIICVALCLAVFCMALDNTIIAVAIPKITDDFKALQDVGWYASAYLLTLCSFQLLYGKIYTYFSIKWVFIIALAIFEVGSVVCGAAPNSTALIVGRAVAGVGAAGIFSGGILIIAHTVPLQKRPIYTGLIGGMYGIASVAGPLLGGVFTDSYLTWRWCFYINLPIGAVTFIFIFFFLKLDTERTTQRFTWNEAWVKMDLPGVAILLPCVVCLLLALQWGGSTYEWSDGRIIALLVLFGVLAIGFGVIQVWKGEHATVPLKIAKQRSVLGSIIFSFCLGAAFFVMVYFLPIWFQAIKGVNATQSGINILPLILGTTIFSIVSGIAVSVTGYYTPWIIFSSVLMATGAGALTTFEVDTPSPMWIGLQIIFGVGVGCGMQQTLMVVQTVLPLKDVPSGTALIMFSQILGGALFSSVAQNVFTNQLIKNIDNVLPNFPADVVAQTGATLLRTLVPAKALPEILTAYNDALTETYYVATATAALSIFGSVIIEWKSMKKGNPKAAAGAAAV